MIHLFFKSKTKEQRHDLVLVQIIVVAPILLVRIIYATIQSFLSTPTSPGRNTWVYLGLLLIPDCISVTIYTICGFKIPPIQPVQHEYNVGESAPKHSGLTPESVQPVAFDHSYQNVEGKPQPNVTQAPPRRRRRQRKIRGPISMLISAIMDRD